MIGPMIVPVPELPGTGRGTLTRMCGIAAILRTDDGPIPQSWVDLLVRSIAWRGPDGHRVLRIAHPGFHCVLVHHRLAVIDLEGGSQPMVLGPADEPELAVTFNGCIYNHRALRIALERLGHRFHTDHSDTEVLLHGYRAWGDQLVNHLEGMYAFALIDVARRTMVTARDAMGEKPLFTAHAARSRGAVCIVGSDPRSISAVMHAALDPGGGNSIDSSLRPSMHCSAEALARYLLLGYSPAGETLFGPAAAPVREVPPGGRGVITAREAIAGADLQAAERDPAQWFDAMLARAVDERLDADRPTGCFLSGGVDSSLIARYAARARPDLPTYCVRMPDPRLDESAHASAVASHLGTSHTTLDTAARNPAHDLDALIRAMAAPFGDSSILAAHLVARAASEHIVVALTGDGGDELFFGYDRYRGADFLARHAWWLRACPVRPDNPSPPAGMRRRLGRMAAAARDHRLLGSLALEAIFPLPMLRRMITAPLSSACFPYSEPGGSALRSADLTGYLPGDLMRKGDVATMISGIEARAPFLDHRIVHAATTLDIRAIQHNRPKALLRSIAARHLPHAIATRRKQGFAVPLRDWLREPHHPLGRMAREMLSDRQAFAGLPIDCDVVGTLLRDHAGGRRDHAHRLFTLLTLALFAAHTRAPI